MEQNFYNNFFSIRDEDLKRGIIHLAGYPEVNNSFSALIDASKAPNIYTITKGSKWADFLYANSLNLVVSERVKLLFQNFEGVNFFPINTLSKDLLALDVNYFNMVINGKSGRIINELSQKKSATRIEGGPVFTKKVGLYFDPITWDKSDFFVPSETLFIFISKKVKEIIEKNNLTNIRITPIIEVENFAS